jgi:hypothetical protein
VSTDPETPPTPELEPLDLDALDEGDDDNPLDFGPETALFW